MICPTRRQFIIGAAASAAATRFAFSESHNGGGLGLPGVSEAFVSAGYDPTAPDAALLAIIADPHILLGNDHPHLTTNTWDDDLINEINSLPHITDLVIAGDLITHNSMVVGNPRYPLHVDRSIAEFARAASEAERFRSDLRRWFVPGNHDTDAFEIDAELWRQEFALPPYQSAVLGGMPVFFLNSGHAGMLNPGQLEWFRTEARKTPSNQEVLIVAHHPAMLYQFVEAGVKRIVAEAFEGHSATVWMIGGHGHEFQNSLYLDRGTRFVQMEVTSANPRVNNDGKAPGYMLLGLLGGRLVHRVLRSLKEPSFRIMHPVNLMPVNPLRWPFDALDYPLEIFEEGFYSHEDTVLAYEGVHVGCHFVGLKSLKLRFSPARYRGKAKALVFAAQLPEAGPAFPQGKFSLTGDEGTWVPATFPAPYGNGIYTVPIPEEFRNAPNLYFKLTTGLTGYYAGFHLCGWAIAGDPAVLTGYQKWLARRYRGICESPRTVADAITRPSERTNIENFGFNLNVPYSGPAAMPPPVAPDFTISGLPTHSKTIRPLMDFRFARRRGQTNPGIDYVVERSTNLTEWFVVPQGELRIQPLNSTWEEVAYSLETDANTHGYCRVRVTPKADPENGTARWHGASVAGGGPAHQTPDELLRYAFDLPASGRIPQYDPARIGSPAGMPTQAVRARKLSRIVFPRMRAAANPGILYRVDFSVNQGTWQPLDPGNYVEKVLRQKGDWEEVEIVIYDEEIEGRNYRIALEMGDPLIL